MKASHIVRPLYLLLMSLSLIPVMTVSCSRPSSPEVAPLADQDHFDPTPSDSSTIESQLKRFEGQTQFLNPYRWHRWGPDFGGDASRERSSAEASREIQESDIFKVGKPGSNLLFLLNNYRGLQIVSFADGSDHPRLLSRVEPSGNWPHDMYYDGANDRILVLERMWYDESGDYAGYNELQSRLLVYDVADPSAPTLAGQYPIKGELAASRMVGDVLYVASSVRPSWQERQNGATGVGYVTSLRLAADGLQIIAEHELGAPVSSRDAMNIIVEEMADGSFRYFMTAVLNADGSWWSRNHMVEVVDITDPDGALKPTLLVSPKGFVQERSQTLIKDSTLVVTSNYTADDGQTLRVAVETFQFPGANAAVINSEEANFRGRWLDRAVDLERDRLVRGGYQGEELERLVKAYYDEKVADPELGLRGRFVTRGSTLEKPIADHRVTVGSSQGLSASVQDVRYTRDRLFIYWVPANNIDPLDVFDISSVKTGVRHLERLEFDGWIQRSEPIQYQGHQYIVGLGWIIPIENNENNRRYPQMVLFELKEESGSTRALVHSSLTLDEASFWTNFNGEDKEISIRHNSAGEGVILFRFSSYSDRRYRSGGKIIGFDLNRPEQAFREGGILDAGSGWLRRVFENPEIDRMHTFSDLELATYDVPGNIGYAGSVIDAVHRLELARNVEGYFTLGAGASQLGIQIVSDYGYGAGHRAQMELRIVDQSNPDSERANASDILTFDGYYVDHHIGSDGKTLWVYTMASEMVADDSDDWGYRYQVTGRLFKLLFNGSGLEETASLSWDESREQDQPLLPYLGIAQGLVELPSGNLLVARSNGLKTVVERSRELVAMDTELGNCSFEGMEFASVNEIDGGLYLNMAEKVADPNRGNIFYLRNFFTRLFEVRGHPELLNCSTMVNVPGKVSFLREGAVIAEDLRLIDLVPITDSNGSVSYNPISANTLAALEFDGQTATLRDLYDPEQMNLDSIHQKRDGDLVFIENIEPSYRGYPLYRDDYFVFLPPWWMQDQRLVTLGLSDQFRFTKTSYSVDLDLGSGARILALAEQDNSSYLALVGVGRKVGVLSHANGQRPRLAEIEKRGSEDHANKVVLPGYLWYLRSNSPRMHYSADLNRFELAMGMYGIYSVQLAQ